MATPPIYYSDESVTLYHGDSFDLLHDLSGIGAVVTDPPYSSGGAFRGDRAMATTTKYVNSDTAAYRPEFAGDNRDQRAFMAWSTMWLNAARKASDPGAVLVSFIDWRNLPVLTDSVQAGGWVYATNGPVIEGGGSPQNVISCKVDGERDHIAQKPESVMQWALQVVPYGATVLDPFAGSGTTLVAAKHAGHKAIGIEVDERYCEVIAKRLAQDTLFGGVA